MRVFHWIILIIILVLVVAIFTQNNRPLDTAGTVKLFKWKTSPDWPVSYSLLLAGLAGYLLSLLGAVINQIRLRAQISHLKRENRQVREELDRLRNLAVEEDMTLPSSPEES
ncbi:DUF1049 domain-containing protein [bacterium]|nr:DUF1049 domain-containing protein [bacterium]